MDDTAALVSLGLTEYGARAYATLIGLGPSGASSIAEAAQVPRTKIYAVLDQLATDGWVEVEGGRPKTYRPADPAARIGQARDAFLDQVADTERRLAALYQQDGVQFGGSMWVVAGPQAIQKRLQRMIADARDELFVSLAFPIPGDADLRDALVAAGRRGIRMRVLVPHDHDPPPWIGDIPADVRQGIVPIRVLFADDKQAMLAFHKQRQDADPEYKGIWNPHAEMVAHLREVTDRLWMAAGTRAAASTKGSQIPRALPK